MPLVQLASLLFCSLFCQACIGSSQGGLLLPSNTSVGGVSMANDKLVAGGMRVSSALSWASANPDAEADLDVGLGYQVDIFAEPDGAQRPSEPGLQTRTSQSAPPVFHGPFAEIGWRLGGSEHFRRWLSSRFELPMRTVGGQSSMGVGALVRVAAELFTTADERGAFGVAAIGGYAEAGARLLPGGQMAFVSSAGLSVRLPLAAF